MYKLIPFVLFFMFGATQCRDSSVNLCDDIRTGLVNFDLALVKPNMESMLVEYEPEPTATDPLGHEQNIQDFIDELNEECTLDASLVCYACIETLPVQTEIKVHVDSAGATVYRIIDIVTPSEGKLTIREIHH